MTRPDDPSRLMSLITLCDRLLGALLDEETFWNLLAYRDGLNQRLDAALGLPSVPIEDDQTVSPTA